MSIKYKGAGLSGYICGGASRLVFTKPLWEDAHWPEETPPPPDDFTSPAPGPIASRIADSYAALIERAEKAEAEVERLQHQLARRTMMLKHSQEWLDLFISLSYMPMADYGKGRKRAEHMVLAIDKELSR